MGGLYEKENINYGSLAERGIRKAWDKACVYAYAEKENVFRLVLFYAGKPFESWVVNPDRRKSYSMFLSSSSFSSLNRQDTSQHSLSRKIP